MSATVQLGKSLDKAASSRKSLLRWWLLGSFLVVLLLVGLWWAGARSDFILETVHPFRVTQVDKTAGIMSLVHGNRNYIVRCAPYCNEFQTDNLYPMKDSGSVVEYKRAGKEIGFPIVEEQTVFDNTGGHG